MLTYLPVFTYCDHDIWYKDVTLKPNHLKDRAKKTQNFGHNNRLIKRQLKSTISSSASSGCWRVLIIHMTLQTMWVTFILITVSRVWEYTLSSLFCQLSSRFIMSSMQWDKVERMPAVVALKVMASPLKSIPFIPLGLAGENTGTDRKKGNDPWLG